MKKLEQTMPNRTFLDPSNLLENQPLVGRMVKLGVIEKKNCMESGENYMTHPQIYDM